MGPAARLLGSTTLPKGRCAGRWNRASVHAKGFPRAKRKIVCGRRTVERLDDLRAGICECMREDTECAKGTRCAGLHHATLTIADGLRGCDIVREGRRRHGDSVHVGHTGCRSVDRIALKHRLGVGRDPERGGERFIGRYDHCLASARLPSVTSSRPSSSAVSTSLGTCAARADSQRNVTARRVSFSSCV